MAHPGGLVVVGSNPAALTRSPGQLHLPRGRWALSPACFGSRLAGDHPANRPDPWWTVGSAHSL